MSAIAIAELVVAAPLEAAFARFIDFSVWDLWLPASYRPISGPARALRAGDRIRVGFGPGARFSAEVSVIRVRANKEICWSWGVPGLLSGEHSFFFAEAAGGTLVRSEEPASGLLTRGPLGGLLEREATKVSSEILSSFAAHMAKSPKLAEAHVSGQIPAFSR